MNTFKAIKKLSVNILSGNNVVHFKWKQIIQLRFPYIFYLVMCDVFWCRYRCVYNLLVFHYRVGHWPNNIYSSIFRLEQFNKWHCNSLHEEGKEFGQILLLAYYQNLWYISDNIELKIIRFQQIKVMLIWFSAIADIRFANTPVTL